MFRFDLALMATLLVLAPPLAAWGPQGHQLAATAALADLPPEVAAWFTGQEATVRDHANDPDAWKASDPLESPRHCLDVEAYGGLGGLVTEEAAARNRLGPELFQKTGQVPWVILAWVRRLAKAFARRDPGQVALEAAILSHYVADLSVPLHTTLNYDGLETGQGGIHDRWEIGLLARICADGSWAPPVHTVELDAQPEQLPWLWLKDSYSQVREVLGDDLTAGRPAGKGGRDTEGPRYWKVFLKLQGPAVKTQLRLSAERTAEMILYAWDRAGRPEAKGKGRAPRLPGKEAPKVDLVN